MRCGAVNLLVAVCCTFSLFFSGCGFQLNRNRVRLINGAASVSIFQIENGSYTSGLEIDLKNELIGELKQRSVALSGPRRADLVLSCEILSLKIDKSKYSLDTETDVQTYRFRFDIEGRLTVLDNRYREETPSEAGSKAAGRKSGQVSASGRYRAIDGVPVAGSYLLKTANEDPSRNELKEGREKAVTDLKDNIVKRISQVF